MRKVFTTLRCLIRRKINIWQRRRSGKRFEVVTPYRFDWARPFSEGKAGVQIAGQWRFVLENGRMLPGDWHKEVGEFSHGLAPVRSPANFLWGFIDDQGKSAVACAFEQVGSFGEDGLAPARLDHQWGYIDRQGNWAVSPRFNEAGNFACGLGLSRHHTGCNFVTKSGSLLLNYNLDDALSFREGLAPVKVAGKWGYLDTNGCMVIEPVWDEAAWFSQGYAAVCSAGQWGAIDRYGNLNFEPKFEKLGPFADGLAPAQLHKAWGFVNPAGEVAIPFIYGGARGFSDGIAMIYDCFTHVSSDPADGRIMAMSGWVKYAYIDISGRWLFDTDFNGGESFRDGLARFSQQGQGVIDKLGQYVIDPRFDILCPVDNRHTLGLIEDKWAVIRCLL